MQRLLGAFLLLPIWGSKAATVFDSITPSTNLTWTPCFNGFNCAKLVVPLDYSDKSVGTTPIAFIKLSGQDATAESPSIVIIPGGPGGSGVDLLLSYQNILGPALGEQYNFVSFDPRGVNNSGPSLDCFQGNEQERQAFWTKLHSTGLSYPSTSSLKEQFDASSAYGERCNDVVKNGASPHGYYVTTPAVAHDLLTFTEAEAALVGKTAPADAKLWAYAVSYGTAVGTTFASMFPGRVDRMVLDGVMNAEQYYDADWRDNVEQMDEAMAQFSSLCFAAGQQKCSFWGPSAENITARVDALVSKFNNYPVAMNGTNATLADLKTLFISALYSPLASFPGMADILVQLEKGDASALVGRFDALGSFPSDDWGLVIRCTDSYRRNKLTTLDQFRDFVDYTVSKSKYIGDLWPIFVETILCKSFRPQLPDSMVIQGPVSGIGKEPTAFPLLFASNTIDPVTPLKTAREMSAKFPGSVLVEQEAIGHTVVNQGASTCYFGVVQAYFFGQVPSAGTICPQQYTPFIDGSII